MNDMPSPTQSEFSKSSLPVKRPLVERVAIDPADLKNDQSQSERPLLGRRAPLALAHFLIIFCLGVTATLAWLSYGDVARETIASSFPRFGWLAPQTTTAGQNTPDIAPIARAASSLGQQQLTLDLDAVRQSLEQIATSIATSQEQMTRSIGRIAASQEQMARTVDQLTAGQEQLTRMAGQLAVGQERVTGEITKLQAIEQYILYKNSEPPPPRRAAR